MNSKETTVARLHATRRNQRIRGIFSPSILLLIYSCFLTAAYADIYKYTDETGSVCITNSLEKVPKKFRSAMTVVREDAQAEKKMLPATQKRTAGPAPALQSVQPQPELQSVAQPVSNDSRKKYITTAALIAGLVAVYFILGKITEYIDFQRVGTVLFLLVVLTGGVYLYGMYIEEMRATFDTLRKNAQGVKKNVETRDLKTEQMLNQLEEKEPAASGN